MTSPPQPTAPAPGWYADPVSPQLLRWFDGSAWTAHTAPVPTAAAPGAPGAWGGGQTWGGGPVYAGPVQPRIGAHPDDPVHWLIPTGRSGASIAAGYVAIFALFIWFLGPFSLGMGVWALKDSARTGSHGRGRALFAVVVGGLTTALTLLVVVSKLG